MNSRKPARSSKEALARQNEELRSQLAEAQETLRAIREGKVDVTMVSGARGQQVFSLVGTEYVYRLIVETMKEAAFTVTFDGRILFCNAQFCQFVKRSLEQIQGHALQEFLAADSLSAVGDLLVQAQKQPVKDRLIFRADDDSALPAHVAANVLNHPDGLSICVVATDLTDLENSTELIQQLRRQQEALRESEENYRHLVENCGSVIIRADKDANLLFMNRYGLEYFGYSAQEIIGKNAVGTIIPRVDSEGRDLTAMTRELVRHPENYVTNVHQNMCKDGRAVWMSWANKAIRDDRGNVIELLAIGNDLSKLKEAEEAILRHSAVLEGINTILAAALSCGTEEELGGACLEVAERITHSKFGFVGQIDAEGLHNIAISDPGWDACRISKPSGHGRFAGDFRVRGIYGRVITDGQAFFTNDPAHHPDAIGLPEGHPPLECFLGVPLTRDGRTIGMIGVGNRPGGYRQVEQEVLEGLAPAVVEAFMRKRAEQQLHELTQRLTYHVDNSPLAVIEWGPDMRLARWSGAAEKIFGWKADEVLGKRTEEMRWVYDEDLEQVAEVSDELKTGANSHRFSSNRNYRKDGSVAYCEWYNSSLVDESGALRSILSLVLDVTKRKKAEEALRQAKDDLEQRVRERTTELSNAVDTLQEEVSLRAAAEETLRQRSQQLRQLASQLTLAEQRERQRLAHVLHDELQQLLVGARFHMQSLQRTTDLDVRRGAAEVDDLLTVAIDCSRTLTGELSPPILARGGLLPALEWLVPWMRQKHGLEVELQIDESAAPEKEDVKILLFQSVRELLFNAAKHSNVKRVQVEAKRLEDRIRITVSDKGVGFDPAGLRARGGTAGGFGLFSVSERLDLLGGRMEIDSAPGQGSRFVLWAPLRQVGKLAPAEQAPSAATPVNASVGHAPGGPRKLRVLLADDHVVVRQGLAQLLKEEPDIEVIGEASDGLTAVAATGQLKPDVVLMDINLPGMDGIEATSIIHAAHPAVRVIGLSMFDKTERAEAMRNAGAVNYLTKTDPSEQLLAAIRACAEPA